LSRHKQLDRVWADLQTYLRNTLPDYIYEIWLGSFKPLALESDILYLEVPKSSPDWVRRRFGPVLNAAAAALDPPLRQVQLRPPAERQPARHGAAPSHTVAAGIPGRTTLRSELSFADFVIGEGNRFAHAAALATAEMPGQAYNPLFIHGPPGVGKTHLLHSIGNYAREHTPTLRVHYTTLEAFTNEFLAALQQKQLDLFKRAYRGIDLLLLDDAQFLEGKAKTAEEFLYTFEAISGGGAQVVLSGDRPPSEMSLLERRARERLQSGLVVDLDPPDLETRLAILKRDPKAKPIASHNPQVLEHLARNIASNVRLLKGALIRIVAFASLTDKPITLELADNVLGSLYDAAPGSAPGTSISGRSTPTLSQIKEATSTELQVPPEDLFSPKRTRPIVYARQVAMYLARELTDLSLPAIAKDFGGRDHTTVLHAHRKIKAQLAVNPRLRSNIAQIVDSLTTHS
jgi:chromosomal replication initiator protein